MVKDLHSYDKYIIAFSGGKDCTACFLWLLDQGIDKNKIELWHHLVDGQEKPFMDWPVTKGYCKAFANHFQVPIYFSWKEGGFRKEMNRNEESTAPITFEAPSEKYGIDGVTWISVGGKGPKNTRLKFPQVSADLKTRWCSAYLKIDVCASAIRNQKRFEGIKTVVISGERGEESPARSKYRIQEPDRSDNRGGKKVNRFVDRLRPIRDWKEMDVWEIIEKYKVVVHPCYYLGWSRCSCLLCIFGNRDQFASANLVAPHQANQVINEEEKFGVTIKRKTSLIQLIMAGTPYKTITKRLVEIAMGEDYNENLISNNWILPAGAYGEGCGPS